MTNLEKQYTDKLKELLENYKSNYLSNPSSWASNNIKLESELASLEAAIKEPAVEQSVMSEDYKSPYQKARDFILSYHWTDDTLKKAENPLALVATMLELYVKEYSQQSPKEPIQETGKELLYKSDKLKKLQEIINSPLTDEERLYIQDSLKFNVNIVVNK